MRKIFILLLYILFFWGVLPLLIIGSSIYLDKAFDFQIFTLTATGILLIIIAVPMLVLSIVQYKQFSGELPVSAYPPKIIFCRGIYNYLRHPIYLFYILMFMGIAMLMGSVAMMSIVMPVFILLNGLYIYFEEKQLEKRFGTAYEFYKKRTGIIFPVFYHLIRYLVYFISKILFSLKIKNHNLIPVNTPYFIVSEHKNYLDPFFIGAKLSFPISYVSSFDTYRKRSLKRIMDKLFCIPLKRFKKDFHSARLIEEALQNGAVIGLFPEGERSWTGETQPFKPEVMQLLLKFRHLPIVPVKVEGNYKAWPRWSDSFKKHPVTIEIREPFFPSPDCTPEKLEAAIMERLNKSIEPLLTTNKPAASINGIDKVLYRCKQCGAFHSFIINNDKLKCQQCGYKLRVTDDYSLFNVADETEEPKTIPEYFQSIKVLPTDIIFNLNNGNKKYPDLGDLSECTLYSENQLNYDFVMQGSLCIERQQLSVRKNENQFAIMYADISSITTEANNKLHIYNERERQLYLFKFPKASVLLWQDILVSAIKLYADKTIRTR